MTTAIASDVHPGPWIELAESLGNKFGEKAAQNDAEDLFVKRNYEDLKIARVFSMGIPRELGGGDAAFDQVCDFLRVLGQSCGSTALALSMHMHLVQTLVWRWKNENAPVEPLLRRIAAEQLVLISSGGSDWLKGSGRAEKVDGGYRVTGRKIFSSGCPAGDLLMTTAVEQDAENGPTVLHFPLPFGAAEMKILETWRTLGMRGTGSHDIEINSIFVPDGTVGIRRPQGKWHSIMHVITMIAIPLIYSVYFGLAEAARKIAVHEAKKRGENQDLPLVLGEMENELTNAHLAWLAMVESGLTGTPHADTTNTMMSLRTLLGRSALHAVEKAMEAAGGASFYRSVGLERIFRDIQAARFHPLQEKSQQRLAGRLALGLSIDEETLS